MDAALIVLDGWGLNPDDDVRDAVAAADTPNFDRYWDAGAHATLETHGRRVGLPEGQMGNSEVGHLNIGAGRVVTQESARISEAIANGDLGDVEAIASAFEYAQENDGRVHLMGLISDGGVHSYQSHVHALIDAAADRGVPAVTHAFTDGRDTSPTGGEEYLADLEMHAAEVGTGAVATVCGRYYAMDRDQNWDRTRRAYDAIVNRDAEHAAPSAVDAVQQSYDRGDTDEFVEPTVVDEAPALADGDAAIFANFRSDRARQLTRMLANIRPGDWGADTAPPDIRLVTMTEYDGTFDLPVAFPPHQPEDTLGEVAPPDAWTDEWYDFESNEPEDRNWHDIDGWRWDGDRTVSGRVWGGCLSIVEWQLMTTRWLPDPERLEGAILALEPSETMPKPERFRYLLRSLGERDWLERFDGLLQVLDTRRPHDRRVDGVLMQEPREGNLCHRGVLLVGQFLHALVDLATAALEVGVFAGVVVRLAPGRRFEFLVWAGEIPPSEGAPRDYAHVLLLAVGEHLAFLLAIEEVVVVLHRLETSEVFALAGVLGAGELVGVHRRRASVANPAPSNGVVEGSQRRLDRCVVVPAVGLVEVDRLHPQSVETVR